MDSSRAGKRQFYCAVLGLDLSYIHAASLALASSLPKRICTSASTCLFRGVFLISALASVARRKALAIASLSGFSIPNSLDWAVQVVHRVMSPVHLLMTHPYKNRGNPSHRPFGLGEQGQSRARKQSS